MKDLRKTAEEIKKERLEALRKDHVEALKDFASRGIPNDTKEIFEKKIENLEQSPLRKKAEEILREKVKDHSVPPKSVILDAMIDMYNLKQTETVTPIAYEFHNYNTGHCYVDYHEKLDMGEKDGYTKIPLYKSNVVTREDVFKVMLGWVHHSEALETTADKILYLFADVNKPKPIPFDANDPSTFPKENAIYQVKIHGYWITMVWDIAISRWISIFHSEVTHYAEIIMPE